MIERARREVSAARAADRQGYSQEMLTIAADRIAAAEAASEAGNYVAADRRLAEAQIDIQLANVRQAEARAKTERTKRLSELKRMKRQETAKSVWPTDNWSGGGRAD